MDYATARQFLITQGTPDGTDQTAFLVRLRQGQPPIPGQVTSILLALKIVFEAVRTTDRLEKDLVCSLYLLAIQGRHHFEQGQRSGVGWPPLLHEDLTRIAIAVKSIFTGVWEKEL
jgi:hypothetical protein